MTTWSNANPRKLLDQRKLTSFIFLNVFGASWGELYLTGAIWWMLR